MLNVDMKIDKNKLVITCDLEQRNGVSSSGNTVTIASTQGAAKIGKGDISLNLSLYTKEKLTEARLKAAKDAGHPNWEAYDAARKAGA